MHELHKKAMLSHGILMYAECSDPTMKLVVGFQDTWYTGYYSIIDNEIVDYQEHNSVGEAMEHHDKEVEFEKV